MSSIKETVRPGSRRLFCKPDEAVNVSKSGILLGEAAEKPKTAVVMNIGTDVKEYKQLDRIIYKAYSTTDVKINEEDYFLIDEDDVLGVVIAVSP